MLQILEQGDRTFQILRWPWPQCFNKNLPPFNVRPSKKEIKSVLVGKRKVSQEVSIEIGGGFLDKWTKLWLFIQGDCWLEQSRPSLRAAPGLNIVNFWNYLVCPVPSSWFRFLLLTLK